MIGLARVWARQPAAGSIGNLNGEITHRLRLTTVTLTQWLDRPTRTTCNTEPPGLTPWPVPGHREQLRPGASAEPGSGPLASGRPGADGQTDPGHPSRPVRLGGRVANPGSHGWRPGQPARA
jgi:hypothetical protein